MNTTETVQLKKETFCRGCWEQMHMPVAIRGPLSYIFKPFGIHKSQMHPNLCTICESMFTKVNKEKQISVNVTILFADLRGYTQLSQVVDVTGMNRMLHSFYDACSAAVWPQDGIVNKFIGDAVLAIFNYPLVREHHITNAITAAIHLQQQTQQIKDTIGLDPSHSVGIGIGIHTGMCNIGEVGNSYKDFTAIGPVVNLASRLQGAAASGEIILSEDTYKMIHQDYPGLESKSYSLKGFDQEIKGFVLRNY